MAVVKEPVGDEVLVDGPEVQGLLRSAARTGDPGGRVDDDAVGLDDASAHQRRQCEPGRGRIATRGSDQAGAGQLLPEQLRQSIGGVGEDVGRRVRLAVPLRIEAWIPEAKIGGEVDDDAHTAIKNSPMYDFRAVQSLQDASHRDALVANISFGVAGACAVVSAILLVRTPGSAETALSFSPPTRGSRCAGVSSPRS